MDHLNSLSGATEALKASTLCYPIIENLVVSACLHGPDVVVFGLFCIIRVCFLRAFYDFCVF
ncbi:unnamed protein product [Brassica napus]|uniref:(rape) hypothetical protein n=1 Tax=Brassica napus TaxID=3708 RepID=A0A816IF63_BRANA|nr:unnamed protein product [Brassica napus]